MRCRKLNGWGGWFSISLSSLHRGAIDKMDFFRADGVAGAYEILNDDDD